MNILLKFIFFATILIFLFSAEFHAQNTTGSRARVLSTVASTIVTAPAKVSVIVVGSAAKVAWVTTKVAVKHVIWPVAKTLIIGGAKTLAVPVAKKALPTAVKLLPLALL